MLNNMPDLSWLSRSDAAQAELLVSYPNELNNYRFSWSVCLPHLLNRPVILSGYGRDLEHAIQCGLKARNYIVHGRELGR